MKIIKNIINILMIISLVLLVFFTINLNIIPFKYILILIICLLLIISLFTYLIIKKNNIIFSIIEILIILLSIFIISKIIITSKFFDDVKNIEETTIYYVIATSDSEYNSMDDLVDKNIGIINMKTSSYTKATKSITDFIKINVNKYNNIDMLLKDLFGNKIDAVLINSASLDVLDEINEGFKDKVKILSEIVIREEIEDNNNIDIKTPINILISGIDTDGNINKVSRSDVNIIMTINPNTNEIVLTHIPRDTMVYLHGIDTTMMDKLTHSGYYGINMTKETIEDFLNIKIDLYVRANFTSLVKVVDSIGGIDVYSNQTFSEYGYIFKEGLNHLDGRAALMYARIRKAFVDGDYVRGVHQEQVIEAIIKKVTNSKTILRNYDKLLKSLSNLFQTNISTELMKEYVKLQLDKNPSWKIELQRIEGHVGKTYVYSIPDHEDYVTWTHKESEEYCSKIINGVKSGFKIETLK